MIGNSMIRRAICWGPLCCYLLGLSTAWGQGVLIVNEGDIRLPRPLPTPTPMSSSYSIKSLEIQTRLEDQVAQTRISQEFLNTGSRQMEVSFVFPLPADVAIDQLTLLVDGREIPGELLPADKARKRYEEIVRRSQDPALLEWLGAGMFQTSVFPVPPGESRTVSLRYSQVCPRSSGLTDLRIPLSTAKYSSRPVEQLKVQIAITSTAPITNLYSPTHALDVKRAGPTGATVTYTGKNIVPESDFRLFYDTGSQPVGANVLSYRPQAEEDGFLLLLAAPELGESDAQPLAKNVILVLDRSGSMGGQKIEQAKQALQFVLNNLQAEDLFNIIAYDDAAEAFRPELQRVTDENRLAAQAFVGGMFAGGGTNIDGALEMALAQLTDPGRPSYVFFLTDGQPTVGERNEQRIVANAANYNQVRARIFSFGVGHDVNSRLLDKLSRDGYGQTAYVSPEEDIEGAVSRLYNRIKAPVLTDVRVEFVMDLPAGSPDPVYQQYPRTVYDLFQGEQLAISARYRHAGATTLIITGKLRDEEQRYEFPLELADKSSDGRYQFVERLWATRRVGEIIDKLDLDGHNQELVDELVALSTRHGILTPYTSFLADETTSLQDLTANAHTARQNLRLLEAASGESGFSQRAFKGQLQNSGVIVLEQTVDQLHAAEPGRGNQAPQAPRQNVVRNIAAKTFFQRNGQWLDSTVTDEQQQQARRIRQFSPEYFELAARNGRELSQYLVFDEPVLVNFSGETYLIER